MNVKFDSIFTLLAILLAAILGYWLYDLSTDVNVKWVIAIGGFLSIASMLVPLMGAKFDDSKITISVKTASTLFLVIILIENFCFATFSEFFSNLYLKFLRHRFGLGRAATFWGDGLFL